VQIAREVCKLMHNYRHSRVLEGGRRKLIETMNISQLCKAIFAEKAVFLSLCIIDRLR
jgi:hypothetical protein